MDISKANVRVARHHPVGGAAAQEPSPSSFVLLTPKGAARLLKVSLSWLAKARMRGDGPPYVPLGRSVRYAESALIEFLRARERRSTSER
jgi:Helix-turn-helix domain